VSTVSVVIPTFNAAGHIAEAIESALAQGPSVMEVIVADDGSADRTREIAGAYPVRLLPLAHAGVSVTRNTGAAVATGEWIAFLDADDIWLPGKTAAQLAAAEADPGVGLFLCEHVFQFDVPIPEWFTGQREGGAFPLFQPSAWFVRKSEFERVGGFEPGRALSEDMNWLMRAWQAGVRHHVVPEVFVIRRIHECNVSSQQPDSRTQVFDLLRESVAIKRRAKMST
jgi:glycosyltransferase involved in cell wall biosynthesis